MARETFPDGRWWVFLGAARAALVLLEGGEATLARMPRPPDVEQICSRHRLVQAALRVGVGFPTKEARRVLLCIERGTATERARREFCGRE